MAPVDVLMIIFADKQPHVFSVHCEVLQSPVDSSISNLTPILISTSHSTANLYWTFNLQYYRITVNIKHL